MNINSVLSKLCVFTSLLKKSQSNFSEPCLDSSIPSYPAQQGLECKTVSCARPCRFECFTLVETMVLDPERKQCLPVLSHHIVIELLLIKWHAIVLHVPALCWYASDKEH